MFDEFVEHSAIPPSDQPFVSPSVARYDQVSYEGFEQSPFSDDDEQRPPGVVEPIETGYISTQPTSSQPNPIFTLGHVQITLPSTLIHLRVASNILIMALHPFTLIIIDLARPTDLITIELPVSKPNKTSSNPSAGQITVENIWPDDEGRHLLVGCSNGEVWYLSNLPVVASNSSGPSGNAGTAGSGTGSTTTGWKKPKTPLKSLKSQRIISVAWSSNARSSSNNIAKDCLIGTQSGQIHYLSLQPSEDLFKSQERESAVVYSFSSGEKIEGVRWGLSKSRKKGWVVALCDGKGWIFEGALREQASSSSGKWAEDFLRGFKDSGPKEFPASQTFIKSLPTSSSFSSSLQLILAPPLTPTNLSNVQTLTWFSPNGVYTASLNPSLPLLTAPDLIPFPTTSGESAGIPIGFASTDFHWLFLWKDRIGAVSRLSGALVWEEGVFVKPGEKPIGLASDLNSKTNWLYTTGSIFEVVVEAEDRDVWKIKLQQSDFESGLKFATTPAQKNVILSAQADSLFDQGRFHQAAAKYAACTKSFEEVVLKFVDAEERDALRYYLGSVLDGLKKSDLTQRLMLATWLVEMYLSKCNTLEDVVAAEIASQDPESLKLEKTIVEDELKQFLLDYQEAFDRKTTYDLFLSHGRTDLYIHFATIVRDYARVVEYWILEEEWVKAIEMLNRQNSPELYYRFSAVLMHNAPKETVDSWLRQSSLDPQRLIPALLQQQHRRRDPMSTNHAIRYLHHVIFNNGNVDPTVHNLLVTFHCSDANTDDGPLLRFLSTCPDDPVTERPYYDLDYALRLCMAHSRIQPCVLIYSKMGLYESSVDLALEKGDLELAKVNADKVLEDDVLRKKLWLKIAKYVVQDKQDINAAMRFLESTDLLKIEDVLPFFPDFVVIDEFKDEICSALESCGARVQALKMEMDEVTQSAELIKRDISNLQHRSLTVEPDETCSYCQLLLVTRPFYVFPCRHTFHADCLIKQIKEYAPASTLRRIVHLQSSLVKSSASPSAELTSSSNTLSFNPGGARTLLSSAYAGSSLTALNPFAGAGDKLRELIVPDALAFAMGGSGNENGASGSRKTQGGGGKGRKDGENGPLGSGKGRQEKIKEELDELLAGSCVLCDAAVVQVDAPFVAEGEKEEHAWAL
ncbi:Vacuolar sorting protein PEP3/VPS18 [Phaffia rhodozyma]|uniref:Vacuolar sorting protein PEP3/VPS18 n=1 Tax=Phaffia rhodozyma TaxID=264483 RepID=A0A0F7SVY6_PHARH|nr:Vacuolar sorting protein PEP3/VPS18 [Phaffia rhodozyma]